MRSVRRMRTGILLWSLALIFIFGVVVTAAFRDWRGFVIWESAGLLFFGALRPLLRVARRATPVPRRLVRRLRRVAQRFPQDAVLISEDDRHYFIIHQPSTPLGSWGINWYKRESIRDMARDFDIGHQISGLPYRRFQFNDMVIVAVDRSSAMVNREGTTREIHDASRLRPAERIRLVRFLYRTGLAWTSRAEVSELISLLAGATVAKSEEI